MVHNEVHILGYIALMGNHWLILSGEFKSEFMHSRINPRTELKPVIPPPGTQLLRAAVGVHRVACELALGEDKKSCVQSKSEFTSQRCSKLGGPWVMYGQAPMASASIAKLTPKF